MALLNCLLMSRLTYVFPMSTHQPLASIVALDRRKLVTLIAVGTGALRRCFILMQNFFVTVKVRDFAQPLSLNPRRVVDRDATSTRVNLGLQMCVNRREQQRLNSC